MLSILLFIRIIQGRQSCRVRCSSKTRTTIKNNLEFDVLSKTSQAEVEAPNGNTNVAIS